VAKPSLPFSKLVSELPHLEIRKLLETCRRNCGVKAIDASKNYLATSGQYRRQWWLSRDAVAQISYH
jgi:hypothetical protein